MCFFLCIIYEIYSVNATPILEFKNDATWGKQ